MKKLLLRAVKLLLLALFPGGLLAQENPDYRLLLNSGNFTPPENAATFSKDSEAFRKSQFGNQHYLVLQFKSLPNQELKDRLQVAGIRVIDYLPNLAYTAAIRSDVALSTFRNSSLRSIFQLSPRYKTVPALLNGNFPPHAVKQPGYVDLTVITYEKLEASRILPQLQGIKARILEDLPMFRTFTLRVPQKNIHLLVELPFVQWVEPIDAPNTAENLLGRSLHRVNDLNDGIRNLKGDGINVGIWDGGEVSPHVDFSPSGRLTMMQTSSASSHSTHVAGTIAGRGIIDPKARGMAPNATLYSYDFNGSISSEMYTAIPAMNLIISSHSYGSTQTCGVTGSGVAYSSTSRSTDINLNTFPTHLHVHSAGNSQTACSGGWSTITGSGKTAKNNILVANITSTEAMSSSSSFGPVHDGRVKPEISSLGTNVLSTYTPLNTYGTISGTSMATPGVSGTLALLVQRYKQLNANAEPPSALIKNAVCNTAHDLGNPGPDYKFGFGRINALAAVKTLEQNRYVVNTISTGATTDLPITVPAGAMKLKVMLTWNDPAGTANATPALVNNLDLSVVNGAATTLPWILDKFSPWSIATRGVDNVSNIEQVTIDNPTAGNYILRVEGTAIATGPNQQYALTWEIVQPSIEITYPNGGESFSPGSSETITWDNAGLTGNQTLQYSLDNGTTWSTLSTNIPAATTRYAWTVPSGLNTSRALIRVSSGPLSDQSDANFRILGTPASLNAVAGSCSGSLNFSWNAVTNATHYDLYRLDNSGDWTLAGANISGTTFTASGLPGGTTQWFTLRAKNNLTGAISERALAISRTISGTGGTQLAAITGQNDICGVQTVSYSVPVTAGVTNYTWSIPPGATLVSGQGTNSISVSYSLSSTSGNVSVYGMTGSCPTSTSNLAVSVGNAIIAPVSAGDLTICANSGNPLLTASASVPAGYNLIWYSAATGGTVVTNPTLSTTGTVTYYAASRSAGGNCESTGRTPVTLTINPVPPATITPNGPATFCEGGSVTLAASPGASYLWSNGATSNSISVSKAGKYSVTITQGSGCSETSVPMAVTVLPSPEVNLSVGPYKNLLPNLTSTLTATVANSAGAVTYAWTKNGKALSGVNGATVPVTIDDLGKYAVTVTNQDGCSKTSEIITIADSTSGTVYIYPNPSTGQFQIRYNNEAGKTTTNRILIYDSKGSRIINQTSTISNGYGKMDVDLRGRGKGIYLVEILDETGKRLNTSRVAVF